MNQKSLQFCVVLGLGLLSVLWHLDISLFVEDEGLYAAIIDRTFTQANPFHLELYGQRYLNKPPLFFWMESLASTYFTPLVGSIEVALRLPESMFSLGTLLLTYHLGVILFSPLAGFWAGVVVATTFLFYWYGRLVLMDPGLTFFMTAGMYCWARAYFLEKQSWWYVVGFVFLAGGTMFKAAHALLLPSLTLLVYFAWQWEWSALRRWPVYVGLFVFLAMVVPYYWVLGPEFRENFFFKESLDRVVTDTIGNQPFHYYLRVMWFDFFPWSVLIPSTFVLLWYARPFGPKSKELFLLVWMLAYFAAFSVAHGKTERYLLPIVPPVALAIGYFYHSVLADPRQKIQCERLLKILLGIFCLVNVVGLVAGPAILEWQRGISLEAFPLPYIMVMIGLTLWLMWHVISSRIHIALKGLGVIAAGWMLGIIGFLLPAMDMAGSPRTMFLETKALLPHPNDFILTFQHWDWRGDEDLYYWQYRHPGANIIGYQKEFGQAVQELRELVIRKGQVVILMTYEQFAKLEGAQVALKVERFRYLNRGKHKIVLVRVVRDSEKIFDTHRRIEDG
ncbi:ArnT family glycosyltransferase [Candidatus Nitronereus thalassa]|uniref:Glycosyltransferase family 39 protein n=1 Tax=Candidatus Nitronereus thalassa TaxID=3020898 RepID=A0ABU3KCE8_9BACT|nr:phospholipid carrier-dependent glycosyltransferase [Candidatus Nitronereus thalassa]MDT7044073.1 glycosyltransferase family 39 protein [Candidatus Nitronereus thalassa]